ncbi:NADAR domain-containing protein [Streptomyces sp. H27-D2]|uniref:NADAR domain-containing protein n=1 Tax=Streptomyces sp. H27-D2 TaxID=3046304 RepID=UPI002DBD09A8|nr:NADAR domain-containing protein [Streptomyces sp. H27-D2]MEC4020142.1 NADAR domain-containing protein [Streptomyces sp. H27-D2]
MTANGSHAAAGPQPQGPQSVKELLASDRAGAALHVPLFPGASAAAGRQRGRRLPEAQWRRRRYEIVVAGSVAEFALHPGLRGYLLGTGTRVPAEAHPPDRLWGIGLAADDERAQDPARWLGSNLLGFALTEARQRLVNGPGADGETGIPG